MRFLKLWLSESCLRMAVVITTSLVVGTGSGLMVGCGGGASTPSLVAPGSLTYSSNSATYTKSVAIIANTPSSSGGAVVSYFVSPALPVGLGLNTTTGVISGTPTTIMATASYTITATNSAGSTSTTLSITINDVAPSGLTYSANPATYTKNAAITANTPSIGGGTVVSYSVSPALPVGLSMNGSSGVISGTPTATSGATSCAVTATNTGGSTIAILTITVNDAAPSGLAYSTNPAVYTKGLSITPNNLTSTIGTGVSFSVSPALPAGLNLNSSTGVVSGTPAVIAATTTYTVTATNSGGRSTTGLSITVNDVAPSGLTYSHNPAVYTKNLVISINSPSTNGGAVVSYAVSPALPVGLSLDTSTGVISGAPTAISSTATYIVTATNSGGSTNAFLNITVNDTAPSGLTYSTNPAVYTKGLFITPNIPTSAIGAGVAFSVSPPLPVGLSLNFTTGHISGTPTAITSSAIYTITATNTGGYTSALLSITVNDVAPRNLTYSTNPATYTKNSAITNNIPSNLGGAVVSYSVSPALPAGLSLEASTGVISGIPTAIRAAASYTVTASNTGGFVASNVNIAVNDAAPSVLTYSSNPATYTTGSAIAANTPSSGGGAVESYSVSPSLPSGLSLNTSTGVISGSPTTMTAQAVYTVTASNGTGNTTVGLVITVIPPGPTITVQPTNATVSIGGTASFNITAAGTGSLNYQWQKNGSNIGGATLSSYTTPTLSLADSGARYHVVVADTYGSQTTSSDATLMVLQGVFTTTGNLGTGRSKHTATLLPNGKVLITGGSDLGSYLSSAELYEPAMGTFSTTGNMGSARLEHTATLLPNGKVLVAGGMNNSGYIAATELYDSATGNFSPTGSLATVRRLNTATLLPNGKVLIAGGLNSSGSLASAELYDPSAGTFTPTGSLGTARSYHTATLLPSGKVLIAGGAGAFYSVELYDPITETFSATGGLNSVRYLHTATLLPNGKVLITGGVGASGLFGSVELYDPNTGSFSTTGSLGMARYVHTATLLPDGKVIIAGGLGVGGSLASAEVYDSLTGTFSATGSLGSARQEHTATLLSNGKVLIAGGSDGITLLASAELYDPQNANPGVFAATGSLGSARYVHTSILLPNGKVLIAGGYGVGGYLANAELYDPATGTFSATGSLLAARYAHTATLLPNGKVLIAGGFNSSGYLASTELYDPSTGSFTATGSLLTARHVHTATRLPNGKVLIAGGYGSGASSLPSAELYDPATQAFTATSSLVTARGDHSAALLPNGKVLIVGGSNSTFLANAELYDPATGTFTPTGSLAIARKWNRTTLLTDGKVLISGGAGSTGFMANAELYDPAFGTFTGTNSLGNARAFHMATLLPNGKVLIAGGDSNSASIASAELYDPATGTFIATGSLASARSRSFATLLPNGKVLIAGGYVDGSGALASVELYQ